MNLRQLQQRIEKIEAARNPPPEVEPWTISLGSDQPPRSLLPGEMRVVVDLGTSSSRTEYGPPR